MRVLVKNAKSTNSPNKENITPKLQGKTLKNRVLVLQPCQQSTNFITKCFKDL